MQRYCPSAFIVVLMLVAIVPVCTAAGEPFITIDPVGNHTPGDTFTIRGTTNLPVNTTLTLQIYYGEFFNPAGTGTSFSDNVIMQPGTGGNNTWSYTTSTAQWHSWGGPHSEWYGEPIPPGMYFVDAGSSRLNVTAATQSFFMGQKGAQVTSPAPSASTLTPVPAQAPTIAVLSPSASLVPPGPAASARNPENNTTYWFVLEPISDIHMGENITINGTTNVPVGTTISYLIDQATFPHCTKESCTHHDVLAGKVNVTTGQNNVNNVKNFSIVADISAFVPDEYLVFLSSGNSDPFPPAAGSFTILPPRNATAPPVAWFYLGSHCENKTYCMADFLDHSENYPTSWNWSFGDGSFSTGTRPSHIFPHNGIYHVSQTVSNSMGEDTAVQDICWNPSVEVLFWPVTSSQDYLSDEIAGNCIPPSLVQKIFTLQAWIILFLFLVIFLTGVIVWRKRRKNEQD